MVETGAAIYARGETFLVSGRYLLVLNVDISQCYLRSMRGHVLESRAVKTAPGPGNRALFTFGLELLQRDPVDVAVDLREQYGHVVRIPPIYPGLDRPAYLVTHPNAVQYILQTHPNKFGGFDVPDFAAVEGSILSPPKDAGPEWWSKRLRQVAPEFDEHAAIDHVPALARETSTTLAEYTAGGAGASAVSSPSSDQSRFQSVLGDQLDPAAVSTDTSGVVRLLPLMSRLSVRLIGHSLFSPDIRVHEAAVIRAVAQLRRAFKRQMFGAVAGGVSNHLPDWLSSSLLAPLRRLQFNQAAEPRDSIRTLYDIADAIVTRRECTPGVFGDAITTWLTRPDPVTGETLTPESARREVVGLLIAGFATVSAALTWAVYLAATHPKIQERIYDEAQNSRLFTSVEDTRGTNSGWVPNRDELFTDLEVTHRVWQESLRLYPTLPLFGRTAREGIELGGYAIEPDAPVFVSPYVTHRDPAFWDHPTEFDPDRFLSNRQRDRPEFAYYPFSAGPNGCLGQEIATTQGVVALAALFREYHVKIENEATDVGVNSVINLQPDQTLRTRLEPRNRD